jgi:hypothetical protein
MGPRPIGPPPLDSDSWVRGQSGPPLDSRAPGSWVRAQSGPPLESGSWVRSQSGPWVLGAEIRLWFRLGLCTLPWSWALESLHPTSPDVPAEVIAN